MVTTFNGYTITVTFDGIFYDYEITFQDPVMNHTHTFHEDIDFSSEKEARIAAEAYIDNWEPSDNYYSQ
jgi:hypothetical protein